MSKELEALERIKNISVYKCLYGYQGECFYEYQGDCFEVHKGEIDLIEKSLKALEMIKKSEILKAVKFSNSHYIQGFGGICITQEEYELLKEVLGNE